MKTRSVSLVIPGRDCAATVEACLAAVSPLLGKHGLSEIIFVDDGSQDATPEIVRRFPVHCLRGAGQGPGSARNLGWKAARGEFVWFVDADCVAMRDALPRLLAHFDAEDVGAVGGSYGNMLPGSLLACLIHEEIVERHRRMPREVSFLATFNVVYRRTVLESLGGFDESMRLAQDAELAYRTRKAGYRLRFEPRSKVGHFHPRRLARYLRTQARQGYYRVLLYRLHPDRISGDSYCEALDYLQPPLAVLFAALVPFSFWPPARKAMLALAGLLTLATLPMTFRMLRRTRRLDHLGYAPLAMIRALCRAAGMGLAALQVLPAAVGRKATAPLPQAVSDASPAAGKRAA